MKQPGWKAAGPDKIAAYWLRAFPGLSGALRSLVYQVLDGEAEVPDWLVEGRTVLIPKEGCEGKPEQFR